MNPSLKLLALAGLSLSLSACGWFGGGEKDSSSADTAGSDSGAASAGDDGSSISTSGLGDPAPAEIGGEGVLDDSATAAGGGGGVAGERGAPAISTGLQPAENVVYFEYDSAALSASGTALVEGFAKFLADNPAIKVRLEGHADERGTREYNIGLGERRANAVEQALLNGGATSAQLSVISYGEERPLDAAHTETSWARNRRVELIKP